MIDWKPIEQAAIPPFDAEKWFMDVIPKMLLAHKGATYCRVTIGSYGYTKTAKGRWRDANYRVFEPTHFAEINEP